MPAPAQRQSRRAAARRRRALGLICMGAAGFFLAAEFLPQLKPVVELSHAVQDRMLSFGRKTPERADLVFVGIDEASLHLDQLDPGEIEASPALRLMAEGFPWHREVYAHLLDRLAQAGARAVVIDLLFAGPREGDEAFAAALERHRGLAVVGVSFSFPEAGVPGMQMPQLGLPSTTLFPEGDPSDPRLGFVNFWPDLDDIVREGRTTTTLLELAGRTPGDDPPMRSLAATALHQAGISNLQLPSSALRFRFTGNAGVYRPIPFFTLFADAFWEANHRGGEVFRNKIVLVGPSAPEFQDFHNTPLGTMPGPKLHLNFMGALLEEEFYREAPRWAGVLLIVLAGFVAWGISLTIRHPLWNLAALAANVSAYFAVAVMVFDADLLLPVLFPTLTLLTGGMIALGHDFALEQLDKRRTRGALERYVSRNVVREILDNRDQYQASLAGTRLPMTILFSDVRGFTSISERTDPGDLVLQLNEYLAGMVDAVFRNRGTVDKFVGDAVMAVWGNVAGEGPARDACNAVRAALDMRVALERLNTRWKPEGRPEFRIGIGLNHGEAVFGDIGSEEKMEPTVIGDAVNLASRIEGLTKKYGVDILVSESVAGFARDKFHLRSIDRVHVVGKSRATEIFAVLSAAGEAGAPDWLARHEEAMALFRGRQFEAARSAFGDVAQALPEDLVSREFARRCEEFLREPPPEGWEGERTLTEK